MNLLEATDFGALEWMLSRKRKYNTAGDLALCAALADIPGMEKDDFDNHMLRIGDDGNTMTIESSKKDMPKILFSAHTDTVHFKNGMQTVCQDTVKQEYFIKEKSGCLGADDGAGVWILLELIKAKIPGLYIFHRGEECGGLGSSYIAESTPDLITGIDFAIAFDRRGKTDIINEQSCGKCCSDEFVTSLADELNMSHTKAHGSFTDTANYAGIIPECTNVSVGYEHEHTPKETLHYGYLRMLMDNLLKVDWSKLKSVRKTDDFGLSAWGGDFGYDYGRSRYNPPPKYISIAAARKIVKGNKELAARLIVAGMSTETDVTWETDRMAIAKERIAANKKRRDNQFRGW